MKKIIGSTAFVIIVIIQMACSEASKSNSKPKLPCIDNLDSSTFDLAVFETQRINFVTNKSKGSLSLMYITPNSPNFSSLIISNDGKSIIKMTPSIVYPSRVLRINGDTMFFGDDINMITKCTSTSFKILSYGGDIDMQDTSITAMWSTYTKR
ncbi:MAG: hypothetical protein V4643_02530 [Bacteroidota bacterium]